MVFILDVPFPLIFLSFHTFLLLNYGMWWGVVVLLVCTYVGSCSSCCFSLFSSSSCSFLGLSSNDLDDETSALEVKIHRQLITLLYINIFRRITKLQLIEGHNAWDSIIVPRLSPYNSYHTLRVFCIVCFCVSSDPACQILIKKAKKAKHSSCSNLSKEDVLWSFLLYFIPWIGHPLPVLALTEQQCNKITKVTHKYTYYTTHYIWSRTLWLLESTECPFLAEHWTNKPLPQPLTSPRQNQQANTHLNESSTTTYWIR